MMRFLLFFIGLTAILAFGLTLVDNPGKTVITWFDYNIKMPTPLFVVLLSYLVLFLTACLYGANWILSLPMKWRAKLLHRKQKIGHQYLTKALIALYSGEIKDSKKWVEKAQKCDPYAPLFHLLMSETQSQLDNQCETRTHLVQLLDFPETELFAYKGLIQDDIVKGLPEKALERVEMLIPDHSHIAWVVETRLRLLARFHYWNKALQTVKLGYKKRIFTQLDSHKMSAVIYCQMAMNSFSNDLNQDAKIWAEKSFAYMKKVKDWSLPACYIISS